VDLRGGFATGLFAGFFGVTGGGAEVEVFEGGRILRVVGRIGVSMYASSFWKETRLLIFWGKGICASTPTPFEGVSGAPAGEELLKG
jgi:hypothetical protein